MSFFKNANAGRNTQVDQLNFRGSERCTRVNGAGRDNVRLRFNFVYLTTGKFLGDHND